MAISYGSHDVLQLRLLAMSSLSLTCAFQYFRPSPLWLPLGWNAIFFGLNGAMAAAILWERGEADRMDEGMRELYDKGGFERRGFNLVEF